MAGSVIHDPYQPCEGSRAVPRAGRHPRRAHRTRPPALPPALPPAHHCDDGTYAWDVISKITARGDSGTPRQAVMRAVALIVCEWVHHQPQPWRRPGDRDRGYLTALTGWGYQPSDVGQLVLAEPSTKGDTEPGDTEPDAEAEWADGHRTWSRMDREEGGAPGVRGTRPSTGCCATKRTPAAETGRGAGHLRPAVTVHVRVRPEGRRPIGLIGALSVRIEGSGPARPELSQRAQTTSAWRPRTVTTSATTGWPPPVTRSPWSTGARWK